MHATLASDHGSVRYDVGNVSVFVPRVTLATGLMYTSDTRLVGQVDNSLHVFRLRSSLRSLAIDWYFNMLSSTIRLTDSFSDSW